MLFSIISAILLILSFPNFNLSFLAFIGFVPLFFAVENKSPKKAFLISYISGFIFYIGTLYWLYHVTVIGLVILCLYLALYFGIFGLVFSLCSMRYALCAIPLLWIFLEYLQAHLLTGFGWALLGYSQYKNIPLIQIADFSGVYGVSFVIMMVKVAMWHVIARLRSSRSNLNEIPRFARNDPSGQIASSAFGLLAMTSLILIAVYTYGFFRINEKTSFKNAIKVSVIQGNIPQALKWDPDAQDMILKKYSGLTRLAALDNPDLIVWPETSFPGFFEIDKEMTDEVLNLAGDTNTPLLIGANTTSLPRGQGLNTPSQAG